MKVLIIYWSSTGNTKRVADTINETLIDGSVNPVLKRVEEAITEDLFEYDLVFIGSPSYMWHPPKPVVDYINNKMDHYREKDCVKLCAPKVPGKKGVVFVTYSGPHTGINEAIPAGKWLGQFFEHLGFEIAGEWYITGELHGRLKDSTEGKLGDIRGRPNQKDLEIIANNVEKLISK